MAQSYFYRRHGLLVRITHWINVIVLTALLMSGLQIFNEHPALYWGKSSYTGEPAILEVPNELESHVQVGSLSISHSYALIIHFFLKKFKSKFPFF